MKISVFKNAKNPSIFYNVEVDEILQKIENGEYEKEITVVRTLERDIKNGDKNAKREKQKYKTERLLSPVFQGTFIKRGKKYLKNGSGLAVIDLDHLKDPGISRDFYFDNYHFIYAAFISPSGDGVKIICRIPIVKNDEEYKRYYINLLNIFDNANIDESTKDISRICFVSHDPELRKRDFNTTSIFKDKSVKQNITIDFDTTSQNEILRIAEKMILNSVDGSKHYTLLKAARLMGGYVASNFITEYDATENLIKAIQQRSPGNEEHDKKTIINGIQFGKNKPITKFVSKKRKVKQNTNTYQISEKKTKRLKREFPIDVLPDLIQQYLKDLQKIEKYDVKVTGSVFFWLMSLIIGNRIELEVFKSWSKSPVLWMAFIAQRGDKKSPTIDAMLQPLENWENKKYEEWEQNMKQWAAIKDNPEEEPIRDQRFIDGGTIEGYMKVHKNNMGGLGLVKDELTSLIQEMETDPIKESFWLKSFNNSSYSKDTKTQGNIRISRTFVNMIGGIQPQKMKNFALKYTDSGMFDRFLFIPFEDNNLSNFTLKKHNTDLEPYYNSFIEFAIESANNLDYTDGRRHIYKIKNKEIDIFEAKYNDLIEIKRKYKDKSSNMYAYMSKLLTYFPRFVTIFEFLKNINIDNEFLFEISEDSINRAFKLLSFYRENAEDLLMDISINNEMDNIVNSLKTKTKTSKVIALLEAVEREELNVSKTEIAEFVGVNKTRISAIISKIKNKK